MERRRAGKRYYRLENALQHPSRKLPYPFVIAHECKEAYTDEDGVQQYRTREYYAFNDVEEYLSCKLAFPHAHEVIFSRCGMPHEGRLCFDFDIEDRKYPVPGSKPTFVAPTFQKDVERCVKDTFRLYYRGVDTTKMRFIWLETLYEHKYSRHLIVKGALLSSDWIIQSQTFYSLFKLIGYQTGLFSYIPIQQLVDTQVARTNATFRMAWCSKLGGVMMKPQDKDVTLYDTLIQVYRKAEAKQEQRIMDNQLAIDKVLSLLTTVAEHETEERQILRNIPQLRRSLEEMEKPEGASIELTRECEACVEMLGDCYQVRSVSEGIIILDRTEPGECPISSKVHDREGGYITVNTDGDAYFKCFRKCCTGNGAQSMLLRSGVGEVVASTPSVEASYKYLLAGKKLPDITPKVQKTKQQIQGAKRHDECLATHRVALRLPMPEQFVF